MKVSTRNETVQVSIIGMAHNPTSLQARADMMMELYAFDKFQLTENPIQQPGMADIPNYEPGTSYTFRFFSCVVPWASCKVTLTYDQINAGWVTDFLRGGQWSLVKVTPA